MAPRTTRPLAHVFLIAFVATLLAACDTSVEQGHPSLPQGFLDIPIPDVELSGYVYLSRQSPLMAYSESLVPSFTPGPSFPNRVGVSTMALWASSTPRVYGMMYEFDDAAIARRLAQELSSAGSNLSHVTKGKRLYLYKGKGDWLEGLKASIDQRRYILLKDAYPGMWDLYNLLPDVPPGQPLGAGFGRLDLDFLDRLTRDWAPELGAIRSFARSAKLENAVFGLYSTESQILLTDLGPDSLLGESGQSAIMASRSAYPSFLVSLVFGRAASNAGFERVRLSEVPNAASGYYHPGGENLHTVINNRGNLFTIAVSGEREATELIMQEAARR